MYRNVQAVAECTKPILWELIKPFPYVNYVMLMYAGKLT